MSDENKSSESTKPSTAPDAAKAKETPVITAKATSPEKVAAAAEETKAAPLSKEPSQGGNTSIDEKLSPEESPAGAEGNAPIGSVVETEGSLPPVSATVPATAATATAPAPQATMQVTNADDTILEMFRQRVSEYSEAMGRGKPMNATAGAQWQRKLFLIVDQILKLQGTLFNKAWSDLLAKALVERESAFHEHYAFRFFDKTNVDKTQLRVYQSLIHLIIHTADPKSRQQMLKLIDIASVTRSLSIPGASDKLYAYYNL